MSVAYGIKVSDTEDTYISTAEAALHGFSQVGIPGRSLVDFLPMLKYVPIWMPSAVFKRKAVYWRKLNVDMVEKPFKHVKDTLVSLLNQFQLFNTPLTLLFQQLQGNAILSLAAALIEALPHENDKRRAEEECLAQNVAAVAYVGKSPPSCSID